MLNRPAAAHAELQDPSTRLEVKAARRKWNPALHPRDSKGRFIETGGTVRLWGGKLARVVRALPHDRILVQDQTGPNKFDGRRHTTSAKWVSMVARPDGSAPTENEEKVQEEDEKRRKDPRRGNGVAGDDAGDPDTPDDPHDVDDRGRPIGDDDDPVGPREDDDQDEPADGKLPINVQALPNRKHGPSRFPDVAAVRQHFLDLAEQPGQKPKMAQFLRSVAVDDEPLLTTIDGRLIALRNDATGRWALTATGTGQRMDAAGEFTTAAEALKFGKHLHRSTGGTALSGGFDFSDPDLDQAARTWRSPKGENIQTVIQRARQEFDAETPQTPQPPKAPADKSNEAGTTVTPDALKPGDRVKITLSGNDIEWPASTRDQRKPGTVTIEGTVAPTYDRAKYAPLLDATLTGPDGTVMTSGDSVRITRTPKQYTVTGHTEGYDPEKVRADRVRVGDIVAGGEFGHVITDIRRFPGGRTFTTRNLGGRGETEQFGAAPDDMMNVIPRARRRPEDVQRDALSRTQQHPNSSDAKRAAAAILKDWAEADELARKQWPDGPPEQFRALAQHMQNVTDSPKGADGYHQNAEAMNGALAAIDDLDTETLDRDLQQALQSLETRLDDNADRFEADAQAIRENKRRKKAEATPPQPETPQPDAPETNADKPAEEARLEFDWNPDGLVTLTMPEVVAQWLLEPDTWDGKDPDTRKALEEAKRRKDGTLKVTAPMDVHHILLEQASALSGEGGDAEPHEIRGYDNYAKRIGAADEDMRKRQADSDANTPSPDAGETEGAPNQVTLTPDEVNAPAAAANAAKAPSAMDDGEIRDEIVSLMEREMANGGELSGVDRTRLRVLEAEEARRAGRKPKDEPKPKPKTPAEEPGGGLFDVGPEEQQRFVADPNNPDDQADDAFGTPDMFAAAEGRDTSKLRPPQSRKPADFQEGDRFVDADGRTHTVAEPPLKTPRGRIRVVDSDGREHFLAADRELRVLHADEEAPPVPETDASDAGAPRADVPEGGTPDSDAPESNAPADGGPETEAPADAEPASAPDQVTIEHSGTGTIVRFPTPNGMVSDAEFAALRSLGFKASRDRTKPRFFYLPSNMTLSRREDRVRRLKEWLDRQNIAYQSPEDDNTEKPELSEEQLQQLEGRYWAPDGTWAVTDFQPGDEVWTGRSWDTVDSIGPKNLRLQGRGSTPYDSILARRRGGEIRTMFDEPADDGTPRPGATDPKTMRDGEIAAELEHLNAATLPEGNDPAARTVRRQVAARIHALTTTQSERNHVRRRDESARRAMAELVRDPERIAAKKGQQIQGRDGAPIGMVYKDMKGKWQFVDRDGRSPSDGRGAALTYPTRAAAITALNKLTDRRNERAGEGWKHSAWDDVQPGDTIRIPELGRTENSRGRSVTDWSEPLEVSEIRRGEMGQVFITGRRGDDDVEVEVPRTDATFGASKPGTVPERERSDAGEGLPWQQMTPDDFGQDDRPTPTADPNAPRPTDEFGTPDLIANGTPDSPETTGTPEANDAPATADDATAPDAPIRETSPADMTDEDIAAEFEELRAWQNRHVSRTGEGPRIKGSAMDALSPVASRREKLREEQDKRHTARRARERKEKEKQERAQALARAEIGKRNNDGSYPVTIDGEDAGTVHQLARSWKYTTVDGKEAAGTFSSRAQAVAALVRNRDIRRENADEDVRREQARSEAPEGWALGDRADVAENDIIRVPITRQDGNGRPYPVGWRQPVRVNSVSRNDNGTMVLSVSNLDGSRSDISPVFLSHPDDTFAWAEDRTRPEPTPEWHYELRARMADIGDDIATLRNHSEGIDDQDRMRRLAELIRHVEDGDSEDLQADLRRIVDETAWLEEQYKNPELPYETQRTRSWATAAHRKAQRALEHPDFQHGSTAGRADDRPATGEGSPEGEAPETPSTAPALADEFAAVRQRYDGEMVPASEVGLGDWVHVVSADPVYNEPAHMVGRVIEITPVLSNGQRRIEVETHLTLNGKDTIRAEFAMINATDLVERLPEGNPGREDSSDLERRIEGELGRHRASKIPVPEGWQAVDGSQVQPRPGDRFRIVARKGGGSGPNGGREHMNITVEGPAEREGYWRIKGQPLSFRPNDIVAIPDGAGGSSENRPDDAPDVSSGVPSTSGQAEAARRVADAAPPRFASVDEVRDRWKNGDLDASSHTSLSAASDRRVSADTPTLEMSEGGRLAVLQYEDAPDYGGVKWWVIAPGSTEVIASAYSREDALAQARIFEGVRDADGNPFPWDAPDAAERARAFRSSDGESLATAVAKEFLARGRGEGVNERWRQDAYNYLVSKRDLGAYYDEWRARQEADGYTIPLDPADAQAGDDITVLDVYPGPHGQGPRTAGITHRAQLRDSVEPDPLGQGAMFPFLVDSHWRAPTAETPEETDEQANKTRRSLTRSLRFRNSSDRPEAFRRPRPGERDEASQDSDDRASRARDLFGEGMNAVGGESLPEMQELDDRLDRADSAGDRDAELRDVADRMDALAEQYELAGPQGELAADRFRRAARIARGEQDDSGERRGDDNEEAGGSSVDGDSSNDLGNDVPENEDDGQQSDGQDDEEQENDENRQGRRGGHPDPDGGAADPDGEPEGGNADAPGDGDGSGDGGGPDDGDGPDRADDDDEQNEPENDEDDKGDDEERRRRRRNRRGGNGGPDGGGPGGPGLPHLNLPDSDDDGGNRGDGGDGAGAGSDGGKDGDRAGRPRYRDVDSLRNAWRNGDGLTADEDTPERRALLVSLADREGLALSPEGGLAMYPEQQADGTTVWRFAQARNGTNLPGITLASDDPEEARELAGRFEEITDRNGDPFDWDMEGGRTASVAAWRDAEGRSLPQALRAVQDDYEQERAGAFNLPEDLTTLSDPELEAAYMQGLGPEDQFRVMAEMDRRDGYVDERIRAAVPDTPPADAAEEERRGRAMDEALGFGDTDVTRSAPATPGNLRRSFDRLDEERFQAAMEATGGRMLSPKAEADGIDAREVFSNGKYSNKRAKELASPELRVWFDGDESGAPGHGRLTYPQYRQREKDRALWAEFSDWNEARHRAATDATNGYFYKREYQYGAPVDESELFSGGSLSANDRWRKYASEELENWFDANGGRITFAQWKQRRRDDDRAGLDEHEEEQRRLAEGADGGGQTPEGAASLRAADVAPAPPASMQGEGEEDAAFRFGGHDRMSEFAGMAELRPDDDQGESVWLNGQRIGTITDLNRWNGEPPVWAAQPFFGVDTPESRSQSRDTAIANLVVHALQDGPTDPANPNEHVWDSVTWRLAGGRSLPDLPEALRDDAEARARYERLTSLIDAFRDQRSPSGNLPDDLAQARDDLAWLHDTLNDGKDDNQRREALDDLTSRTRWAGDFLDALGGRDSDRERPHGGDEPKGDGDAPAPDASAPGGPVNTPEGAPRPTANPEPEPDPEPIGGQPAHWARVEDLVPGDMVRMDGTTQNGKQIQRAGYVYQGPELVDVTRHGRTEQMWRTWVTENPDGTGASGNVYTTHNAAAARAEAPDDVAPGSPVSGAQSTVRSGNLPDRVPTDRNGRALFPGSTVTGVRGIRAQEGTVTGATDRTVSVRWDDDTEDGVNPASLAVTSSARPDGWTTNGQQIRPDAVVADTDGALLGPVDDIDGDSVTIATAQGKITRSAGDLRVTGEVRDDVPDTDPVTGIDEPTAADLKDGDVVVLDTDGTLATVAVTGTRRDGGRVIIDYADTTTGEMGELDVDAHAVFTRALGPDGGAPDLGPDDAPNRDDDLVVHPAPQPIAPVTGPTVDPELNSSDRDVIGDHAAGPDDNPDAHQAAVRITADLPVTPEQASALAAQLREAADPSTLEGRAALRAADHLDRAAGQTPPAGLDRPRPSNAAQLGEGDLVAMPDERHGDQVRVFRVIDVEDGPGGMRSFLLEDEDQQWRRRIVHGAMPVWQLPEAAPEPVNPPDPDDTDTTPTAPGTPDAPSTPTPAPAPAAPDSSSTPDEPSLPVARVKPGNLRVGDVIDAPVSRTGYQFNGHRRLTIISPPHRNGWWMQLTGIDEDGNVHDFGLHSGRAVAVYDRNRPTPALPPVGTPRDPNQPAQSDVDRITSGHARSMAARIIDEAIAGTEPPGDIHALREQIAQRLTREALNDARQAVRRDGSAQLDAAGITGRDRADAQRRLRDARQQAHADTVRAALRTINDLEPLPDESDEDLAARARDLLRLIPEQVAGRPATTGPDADPDVTRTVTGHADDAVNALLQQLQSAGVDPGDAERIVRTLTQHMAGTRQATARRIARRIAAANPDAGRQPGLLARIVAALIRMAKRLGALVMAGARKIAEKYQATRERLARLRAFLGRMVRRVRHWPESRRLARLHRAVNLPDADGESLAARISHWAGLMPEPGRFGQSQRRVTFWRPTTWGQLAAGRLPDRSDRIQWTPDRAADGGPGLTALRHMAALRAAGSDVDQDVTRRLSAALGDDFGDDPHATLQHMDDYVATNERRLINLQAARSGATIPDDEDLEVEITAARAELSTARREYEDLRARYAAAVPDAVAAALADIRDMGPEGSNAIVFGPDTTPDAERAIRGVQRLIPRAWLNTPEARRITAVDGVQGRYEPDGQRITVADLADEGLGTAGHALAQHLARHLGDLDAAQRAYWFTRTHTGRPGARRMQRSAMDRLLRRQQTQPQTGDSLARSVQSMFSGDWYQDDDLRAFLLGLLATR
ncbi:hypothetical protein [Streptomyces sp. CL12-4]|uniref:hypothetical protein n=1 Tax=Streptomyces sp. CL12-4 TaxID=2810306 RepID=UPI001EFA72EC|nr:hypothetical protein [Streptomyces sp. CL12-4]MCG8971759.1 hypothetical protein [Streptomyces sp. CL12-4]